MVPAADVAKPGRQLYRATTTWVSENDTARIQEAPTYVYVTPDQVQMQPSTGAVDETLPNGSSAIPCPPEALTGGPFSYAQQGNAWCWSKADGRGTSTPLLSPALGNRPGFGVEWDFPMLIAAIDPQAEAELDGLDHAVTSGQYLPETLGPQFQNGAAFPLMATTDSGLANFGDQAPGTPRPLGAAVP